MENTTTGGEDKGVQPEMITQFQFLSAWITSHVKNERGASLVEYALLVALIAVVCIAAVTTLGNNAGNKFSSVGNSIGS
jgi:pilus assembly protein Flp/PilA